MEKERPFETLLSLPIGSEFETRGPGTRFRVVTLSDSLDRDSCSRVTGSHKPIEMILFQTRALEPESRAGFKPLGACLSILLTLAPAVQSQPVAFNPAKVVIVKADDFKVSNQAWTNFITESRNLGVKVGLGVVVEDTAGNAATATYMQAQQAQGDVEFWNHGWDHSRWTTDGGATYTYEFKDSGLAFQQTHFADAQAGLLSATGRDAIAFGTPYNQSDADTVTIMNNTPAVRLFFTYNSAAARNAGLTERVATVGIIGEKATGKPLASDFIDKYPNGPAGPVSLQFHPLVYPIAESLSKFKSGWRAPDLRAQWQLGDQLPNRRLDGGRLGQARHHRRSGHRFPPRFQSRQQQRHHADCGFHAWI
jgi:hypothetical protein